MIALQVQDVKDFMSRLLIGTDFDAFWLCEANVTTFVTYHIDGSLHKEFFDSEQAEMLARTERTFSTWKEIKPFCFSIMKGKHTPLHFKIVFQLSRQNVEKLLVGSGRPVSEPAVRRQSCDLHNRYIPENLYHGQVPGPGVG